MVFNKQTKVWLKVDLERAWRKHQIDYVNVEGKQGVCCCEECKGNRQEESIVFSMLSFNNNPD